MSIAIFFVILAPKNLKTTMKNLNTIVIAIALLLGICQCKKDEPKEPNNVGTLPTFNEMRFSVSDSIKVVFSPGNLNATSLDGYTWSWSFASSQDAIVGDHYSNNAISGALTADPAGTVDLFGWVGVSAIWETYGINDSKDYHQYGFYSYDTLKTEWGTLANEASLCGYHNWRTLSDGEWAYVFFGRTDAGEKHAHGNVNGQNGMILLPDEWTLPDGLSFHTDTIWSGNIYNSDQWAQMEGNGAVFLPAAGYRESTDVEAVGEQGYYWSKSADYADQANTILFDVVFDEGQLFTCISSYRYNGYSVRLVHNVE